MFLLASTNWKDESYDSIMVIVDCLTKMVYYKPIKVTINIPDLAKVIIDMIVYYHDIPKLIVIDQSLLFISKF